MYCSVRFIVKFRRAFHDDGVAAVSPRGYLKSHRAMNVARDDVFSRRSQIIGVRILTSFGVGRILTSVVTGPLCHVARPASALCLNMFDHPYGVFSVGEAKYQKVRGGKTVVSQV